MRSRSRRYGVLGALLGCGLPLLATGMALWREGCQCSMSQVMPLHANDPLLLLIDTAPFFTGTLAFLFGRQYDQLQNSLERNKKHARTMARINRSISRFVPGELLRLLNHSSILGVRLGDNAKREMAVLFTDIRGFTSLSEKLTPDENFRFLNSYLKRMEPAIHAHNGFIDKFVGDSIMALFHDPEDALKAALAMFDALITYNRHRARSGFVPIDLGMGINSGPLMLGTIGGRDRMEGTVIGDNVNVASRVERMTRKYDVRLLVSEQTLQGLENAVCSKVRRIDEVSMSGREQPVVIFEVLDADRPETRSGKTALLEIYNQAIDAYCRKEYQAALPLFQTCLNQCPADLVSAMYIDRIKTALRQSESACQPTPSERQALTGLR